MHFTEKSYHCGYRTIIVDQEIGLNHSMCNKTTGDSQHTEHHHDSSCSDGARLLGLGSMSVLKLIVGQISQSHGDNSQEPRRSSPRESRSNIRQKMREREENEYAKEL